MGGLPFPPLMEIAASARGAKVILPTAAELDKLEKASKLLKRAPVAPGLLPGIDKETETITTGFFIIVRDDFPEELAYKIAKVLDTNHAELVKAYKAAEASTAAATVARVLGGAGIRHTPPRPSRVTVEDAFVSMVREEAERADAGPGERRP